MANLITRRNFLKCAGVAVLAVTASGIFTGCESGGGELSGYGVNQTVDVNGVKVTLLGYEQYGVAEIVGNYTEQSMVQICFKIDNQTDQVIDMGNSTENEAKKVWDAIKKNDYGSLRKSNFVTMTTSERLGNAAIAYKLGETGTTTYGTTSKIEPGKKGCIKVFTAVPSNWQQIGIQYTPEFAQDKTLSFVLNNTNKISKI